MTADIEQLLFKMTGYRGFSGAGKPREPYNNAFMLIKALFIRSLYNMPLKMQVIYHLTMLPEARKFTSKSELYQIKGFVSIVLFRPVPGLDLENFNDKHMKLY